MVRYRAVDCKIEDVANAVTKLATLCPMRRELVIAVPKPPFAFAVRTDFNHSTTKDLLGLTSIILVLLIHS